MTRLRPLIGLLSAIFVVGLSAPTAASAKTWPPSDVIAKAQLPVGADLLFAQLSDLRVHQAVWMGNCGADWAVGSPATGVGAQAALTVTVGSWQRPLQAALTRADAPQLDTPFPGRVDLDHAGKKGFVQTWTLTPLGAAGTAVELHTYIAAPPFPFRRAYFRKIQPGWQACHAKAIQALGDVARR